MKSQHHHEPKPGFANRLPATLKESLKGRNLRPFIQGLIAYVCKFGVRETAPKITKAFKEDAARGNPESWFALGFIYSAGLGVEPDAEYGMTCYEKSAELGFAWGMCQMGVFCEEGTLVRKDLDKALHYYRSAMEKGCPEAIYRSALFYEEGRVVKRSTKRAFRLFRKAAKMGWSEAMYKVGYYHEKGILVKPDPQKAARFYRKGSTPPYKLSVRYYGRDLIPNEVISLAQTFQDHLERRCAESTAAMGRCRFYGIGVSKSEKTAADLFRRSALLGNPEGQFRYGWCCQKGVLGNPDPAEALLWYSKAAEQNHDNGAVAAGICYFDGCGAKRDRTIARHYFEGPAARGNKVAKKYLRLCNAENK